jgi:exosortase/archaeosortase family protein
MQLTAFRFLKNPIYTFLFKALGLYILWYIVYELWLHPIEKLDIAVIKLTLKCSTAILNIAGYHTFSGSDRLMGIDGTNGLWMGDNCDSVELCALFAGFILAFPGNWVKKSWYIPIGLTAIFLLNVVRMILLAIIQKNMAEKWLKFNHTYTFTIIVYLFIFLLWYYWIKKLSYLNGQKKPPNE